MEITSSVATVPSSTEVEAVKKSIDTQEQQVLKILESANEESQKAAAQKTGIGTNLNIAG